MPLGYVISRGVALAISVAAGMAPLLQHGIYRVTKRQFGDREMFSCVRIKTSALKGKAGLSLSHLPGDLQVMGNTTARYFLATRMLYSKSSVGLLASAERRLH